MTNESKTFIFTLNKFIIEAVLLEYCMLYLCLYVNHVNHVNHSISLA